MGRVGWGRGRSWCDDKIDGRSIYLSHRCSSHHHSFSSNFYDLQTRGGVNVGAGWVCVLGWKLERLGEWRGRLWGVRIGDRPGCVMSEEVMGEKGEFLKKGNYNGIETQVPSPTIE